MNKEQVAHDLALLIVKSRFDDLKSEHSDLGLNNYADQAVEDYNYVYKRILEQLD